MIITIADKGSGKGGRIIVGSLNLGGSVELPDEMSVRINMDFYEYSMDAFGKGAILLRIL